MIKTRNIWIGLWLLCYGTALLSTVHGAEQDSRAIQNFAEIVEELSQAPGAQRIISNLSWLPTACISRNCPQASRWERNLEVCAARTIQNYGRSVVRLHTPVLAKCELKDYFSDREFGQMSDQDLMKQEDLYMDSYGCTAWRFSDTLFATAWHCMPDGKFSCDAVELHFDYVPSLEDIKSWGLEAPSSRASRAWSNVREECTDIVYANAILDVVIFRVTNSRYSYWGDGPVLPIMPLTTSFPSPSEKLLIIQFPAPGDVGCAARSTPAFRKYGDYQSAQQLSLFGQTADPFCRIVPNRTGGVRWSTGRSPYPGDRSVCGYYLTTGTYFGPPHSIMHRCDTCGGSSGAPIMSLTGERACTVIGIHTNQGDGRLTGKETNAGLRMSVLGECIDFEKSQNDDEIVLRQDNAAVRPECLALIPSNIDAIDCRTRQGRTNAACRFYQ